MDIASLAQIVLGTPLPYRRAMAGFLEGVSKANAEAYQMCFGYAADEGPWGAAAILGEVQKGVLQYSGPRAARALSSVARNTMGPDGETRLKPMAVRILKQLLRADDLSFLEEGEEGDPAFETVERLGYGFAEDVVPFAGTSLVLTSENTGDSDWFTTECDSDGRTTDLYRVVVSVRRPVLAEVFREVAPSSH
ncbi:hypothetical protein LZC95_19590 [Pendulispora brunnea]|uniref:Uncharacterized protein n=1 Tax=Pendulispora brunnea TaxID=2905690 RepID=A0ABZ2KKF7_9BACT